MKAVVQKFGGTSVANPERIRKAAERALMAQRQGQSPIVVVSAMAGETDRLLALCSAFDRCDAAETDVVASTGETVSAAMMSLAIRSLGGKARSFLSHQLPILTNSVATQAQILSVNANPLLEAIQRGEIPVVAGFQGVDEQGRVTTLGRGGSDTTAVAIAAAIPGAACEIFTDVDGVFSADPRQVPSARHLPAVSYGFMIEASTLGAKVMHDRSVILGRQFGVPINVKNSFNEKSGTLIGTVNSDARCITSRGNQVSVVGDFVKGLERVKSNTWKILKRNGMECFGFVHRDISFTAAFRETDVPRAASLFHRTFVEQLCS